MEFEIQSSANQESRIVLTRSTSYSLLEIRLVFFFSDLFVSIILLANMGRNSRCISTGKSILLVFVEATRKRIGLGENGACRRT